MVPEDSTLRLGTSSWSCAHWVGKFYESGTNARDYIASYARKLDTVEIDSTFYAMPRRSAVEGWRDRTPESFVFAAKAPKVITHDKSLVDCDGDLHEFLDVMSVLGPRLGPILLQFPYFSRASGVSEQEFLTRLKAFLPCLPRDRHWALETRNKAWIRKPLLELLREHGVALALIDHPWMARPAELFAKPGIQTAPFMYVRWLGDRHGIEKRTKTWNETIIDRRSDLQDWIPHIKALLDRRVSIFGYVNNHYAGYAPGTLELLGLLLRESGVQAPV